MSSGHKRPHSPLAERDPSTRKILRRGGHLVALDLDPQSMPGELYRPMATFGNNRASPFTLVSRHPFDRVTPLVPGAPDVTSSTSHLAGGGSPLHTDNSAAKSTNNIPDNEQVADSMDFPIRALSDSPTPAAEEVVATDDPMGRITDSGSPAESMPQKSPSFTAEEVPDDARSDGGLSYASYHSHDPTDRSVIFPPSDDLEGTPRGRRSPFLAISSQEFSLHQARRSGTPVKLLKGTDDPQGSGKQISIPLTIQGVEVPNQLAGTKSGSNGTANARTTLSNDPVHDGRAPPNDNPANDGPAPPRVDTRAPSIQVPPHRVRTRGAFIVGNGAPVRVDEAIEVYLRDGVGGQVDFIV